MKNKMVLATLLLLTLAFAIPLGTSNVFAQGPINTSPGSAIYLDNQTHFVPPNTTLWYKFDYNAERLPVEIKLFSGVSQQMQFNVYTPNQIGADFGVGNPIGRGAAPGDSDNLQWKGVFYGAGTYYVELINSTSTARTFLLAIAGGGVTLRVQPPAPTPIPTRLLPPPPPLPSPTINLMQVVMAPAIATLRASAALSTTPPEPAPPFIVVIVATATPVPPPTVTPTPQPVVVVPLPLTPVPPPTVTPTPQPVVVVALPPTPVPPPTVTPTPQPVVVVALCPTPVPSPTVPIPTPAPPVSENNWWTTAYYVVNGRTLTIPGNSGRWFAFDYAGDGSKIEIRISGGNRAKLQFRLFTPDQVLRYTVDDTPTGVGTAPIVPWDAGTCTSNDLVWTGDFSISGTFFIQVINFDPPPKNYEIFVTGSGVTLVR